MKRKPNILSIWDVDPLSRIEHDYDEFEQLFLAAYEHRFHTRAHSDEIRPYLNRYFCYRVIPPWLRDYVQRVCGDEVIDDIDSAPIDPSFDWHTAAHTTFYTYFFLQQMFDPPIPRGPLFPA